MPRIAAETPHTTLTAAPSGARGPARRRGSTHAVGSPHGARRWWAPLAAVVFGASMAWSAAPALAAAPAVPTAAHVATSAEAAASAGSQALATPTLETSPGLTAAPGIDLALGKNVTEVTIDDTAHVLNQARLNSLLDKVSFYQPTKVAIYTRTGAYSDNHNLKTLEYARTKRPEWISSKPEDYGDYWADGLLLVSLTVEPDGHGQIGTYFGEDRAGKTANDSTLEKIHAAGIPDFRQQRWTDGIAAIVDAASKQMDKPWYKSGLLWTGVGVVGGGSAIIAGVGASQRAGRRTSFAEQLRAGTTSLGRVTTDLDVTELSARTLPTGSPYAADLERRFGDFVANYRVAFTEQQALEELGKKERGRPEAVTRATRFADQAADLDFTDDSITQAAALYTRSATWQDAWRAQTAPILEDLDGLSSLPNPSNAAEAASNNALLSFQAEARAFIERLGRDLDAQTITVDQALDQLAAIRKDLTGRLDQYARAQIDAYARSQAEKSQMEEQLRQARYGDGRRRGTGSILDVTSPGNLFWRVMDFNLGYSAGQRSVDHSRQAAEQAARSASSGGISRGYGGGGGGGSFSGSGGSSRF